MYQQFNPDINNILASNDGFAEFCKYTIILLGFIIAPGTLIYVIKQDKKELDSAAFKNRFGSLYLELNTNTR
jgi:hypothetical protein